MALGMTKDSMVDLQSLVQEKNDLDSSKREGSPDDVDLLMTGMSRDSKLSYERVSTGNICRDPIDDHPVIVMEEPTKPKDPRDLVDGSSSNNNDYTNDEDDVGLSLGPQEATDEDAGEEKKQDPLTTGRYVGFANDYDPTLYDAYQHFQYHQHPQTIIGGPKQRRCGFLCCLFPWLSNGKDSNSPIENEKGDENDSGPGQDFEQEAKKGSQTPTRRTSSSGDDDDGSTASVGSEGLGERLSDKDRQAVLARLRLAQPDKTASPESPEPGLEKASDERHERTPDTPGKDKATGKGLLSDIPSLPLNDKDGPSDDSKPPQGILKRQSTMLKQQTSQTDTSGQRRRSLFPTYDNKAKKKNDNHVDFAPMARVVTVKSQKDMTEEEKSGIWWQRCDYEDFRKTGRIITRAMLEGGSEIWLASNKSWQHNGMSKSKTLKNAMSLAEQPAKNGETSRDEDAADLIETTDDKWWHSFGHSRRGLEHIASIKEGSERQANVRHAIRAVLDEQRRQRTYMRQDPEKLRMIAVHNTSWARDLALAAGASDADAVKSNFDEERKSREFYLLKMARSNSTTSRGKHVPAFMQPAMNTYSQQLDANTSGQIKYRQKQEQMQRRASRDSDALSKKDRPPQPAKKSFEPIHDPERSDDKKDLAKRAAGFSHEGAEDVNMAAVLSGMGAVPKKAQAVGAH